MPSSRSRAATDHPDRLGFVHRHGKNHPSQRVVRHLGKGKIVPNTQARFGHARNAQLLVVDDQPVLNRRDIGRDQAQTPDPGRCQDLVQRQHRGDGADAGGGLDPAAKAFIGLEPQPARRGAVPGDDIDLGMRQKLRRREDRAVVKLRQRITAQGDLGHAKA
jgi:hypothetical protein